MFNSKKGFGLIAAIFILVLLSSLSAFLMNITTVQRQDINDATVKLRLKLLAKSGLEQMLYQAKSGLITSCTTTPYTSTSVTLAAGQVVRLDTYLRNQPTVTATIPCVPDTTATNTVNAYGKMYHNGVYSIHFDPNRAANLQYFQNIPIIVTASVGTFGTPGYVSYTAKAKAIVYYGTCTMSANASCNPTTPASNLKTTLVFPNSQ